MVNYSKLLIKAGFMTSGAKGNYDGLSQEQINRQVDMLDEETAQAQADEEIEELAWRKFLPTGYPNCHKRYWLVIEDRNDPMEELYYWVLDHLRKDQEYPFVEKTIDTFSASENSAFWGQGAMRLSTQQDKATQILQSLGQLIKSIFPIVRELRVIDERLDMYDMASGDNYSKSADISLKDLYINFVENKGGQSTPASVYGLAQQLNYAALPDLFFNVHVDRIEQIESAVDRMDGFNDRVKRVLKQKLMQYLTWKTKTHQELRQRRKFNLKYLRQHWAIIKMNITWVKPYLRNIKRLTMDENATSSADMVGSFEGSMSEIEFVAYQPAVKGFHPVIIATFKYRTRPEMTYRKESYTAPQHIGKAEMNLRAYSWTKQQIDNFKKMRELEDFEMLRELDMEIGNILDAMEGEIKAYLEEAGEKFDEPEKSQEKTANAGVLLAKSAFDPALALFSGFKEMAESLIPVTGLVKAATSASSGSGGGDPSAAKKIALGTMYQTYKNYKKSHKLTQW